MVTAFFMTRVTFSECRVSKSARFYNSHKVKSSFLDEIGATGGQCHLGQRLVR
jgi:hypothetical protein